MAAPGSAAEVEGLDDRVSRAATEEFFDTSPHHAAHPETMEDRRAQARTNVRPAIPPRAVKQQLRVLLCSHLELDLKPLIKSLFSVYTSDAHWEPTDTSGLSVADFIDAPDSFLTVISDLSDASGRLEVSYVIQQAPRLEGDFHVEAVLSHIQKAQAQYIQRWPCTESIPERPDERVDVCLYVLPTDSRIDASDLSSMIKLGDLVPTIPVMVKVNDEMTPYDVEVRRATMSKLEQAGLKVFDFPENMVETALAAIGGRPGVGGATPPPFIVDMAPEGAGGEVGLLRWLLLEGGFWAVKDAAEAAFLKQAAEGRGLARRDSTDVGAKLPEKGQYRARLLSLIKSICWLLLFLSIASIVIMELSFQLRASDVLDRLTATAHANVLDMAESTNDSARDAAARATLWLRRHTTHGGPWLNWRGPPERWPPWGVWRFARWPPWAPWTEKWGPSWASWARGRWHAWASWGQVRPTVAWMVWGLGGCVAALLAAVAAAAAVQWQRGARRGAGGEGFPHVPVGLRQRGSESKKVVQALGQQAKARLSAAESAAEAAAGKAAGRASATARTLQHRLSGLPASLARSASSGWSILNNAINHTAERLLDDGVPDAALHGWRRYTPNSPPVDAAANETVPPPEPQGSAMEAQGFKVTENTAFDLSPKAVPMTGVVPVDSERDDVQAVIPGEHALSKTEPIVAQSASDAKAAAADAIPGLAEQNASPPAAVDEGKESPAAMHIQCHQLDTSEHESASDEDRPRSPRTPVVRRDDLRAPTDETVAELMRAAKELCARFRKLQRDVGQAPAFEVRDVVDAVMWLDRQAKECGSLHAVLGLPDERTQAERADIEAWIHEAQADAHNAVLSAMQDDADGTGAAATRDVETEGQGAVAEDTENVIERVEPVSDSTPANAAQYYVEDAVEDAPRGDEEAAEPATVPEAKPAAPQESVCVHFAPAEGVGLEAALKGGEDVAVVVTLCVVTLPTDAEEGGEDVANAVEASSVEEVTDESNSLSRTEEEVIEDAMALESDTDVDSQREGEQPHARKTYAEALSSTPPADAAENAGTTPAGSADEQPPAGEHSPGIVRKEGAARAAEGVTHTAADMTNTSTLAAWQMHPLSHDDERPRRAARGAASRHTRAKSVGSQGALGRVRRDDSAREPADAFGSTKQRRAAPVWPARGETYPFTAFGAPEKRGREPPALPAAVVRVLRRPDNLARLVTLREVCDNPALLHAFEMKLAEDRIRLELDLQEERQRFSDSHRLCFDLAELQRAARANRAVAPLRGRRATVSAATSPMTQGTPRARRRSRWVECAAVASIVLLLLGLLLTFLILSAQHLRASLVQRHAELEQQLAHHDASWRRDAASTQPSTPHREDSSPSPASSPHHRHAQQQPHAKDTYIRVAWDTTADIIRDVDDDLHEGAHRLAPKLDYDLHAAYDAAAKGGEHVVDGVRAGASKVVSAEQAARHAAANAASNVREGLHAGASKVASSVEHATQGAWHAAEEVRGGAHTAAHKAASTIEHAAHAARHAAVNTAESVHDGVHAGVSKVATAVDHSAQAVKHTAASAAHNAKEGVHAGASKVASSVDHTVQAARHTAASAVGTIKDTVHAGVAKVASTVEQTAQAARDTVARAVHNVKEGVEQRVQAARNTAAGAVHQVKDTAHAGAAKVTSTVDHGVQATRHAAASAVHTVEEGVHAGATKVTSAVDHTIQAARHTAASAAEHAQEGVRAGAHKAAATADHAAHAARQTAVHTAQRVREDVRTGASKAASALQLQEMRDTAVGAAERVDEGLHAGANKVAAGAHAMRDTTANIAATVRDRVHAGAEKASHTWRAASDGAAHVAEDIRVGLCPSAAGGTTSRGQQEECRGPSQGASEGVAEPAAHQGSVPPSAEGQEIVRGQAPDFGEMVPRTDPANRVGSVIQYDVHISEADVHAPGVDTADVHALRTDVHLVQTDVLTGPVNDSHQEAYSGSIVWPGSKAIGGEAAQDSLENLEGVPVLPDAGGAVRMRRGWPPYEWWGESFGEFVTLQRVGLVVSAVALVLALRPE